MFNPLTLNTLTMKPSQLTPSLASIRSYYFHEMICAYRKEYRYEPSYTTIRSFYNRARIRLMLRH